ncbi:MAG: SPFH domain-containing protein [Deltaproteobacteria bacterium]|nr:SPFH domain-containing protein [Deltaproteobacteria bacterium]
MATSTTRLRVPTFAIAGLPFGIAAVVLFTLFAVVLGWFTTTVQIAPDEFGVRQVYLGPGKGVQREIYGPGTHVVLPGYERMHLFPRDLQILDINDEEVAWVKQGGVFPEDYVVAPSIRIQTSEGYQVQVDVTVIYRVIDPYTVLTKVGSGRIYETKIVQRGADQILRQYLGRLDAEDFYNETRRIAAAEAARKQMQAEMSQWGVQVWGVLVRGYAYDERYQAAIEQRKIQDQNVFKNQAEAISASREAEKNRVIAEGQARIAVEGERGRAEVRKIDADADLYFRQRVAEGQLKVRLAEAEGTRLENTALEQAGASNIVGLEMAKALSGTQVIVLPTSGPGAVNPLDLESMLRGW